MSPEGPILRRFQGSADLHGMHAVTNASMLADGMGMVNDFETFSQGYERYMESLPSANVIVAEEGGAITGHAMVWWRDVLEGRRLYSHQNHVLPDSQFPRAVLIDWAEARLREIAALHPKGTEKILETQAVQGMPLDGLMKSRGYAPSRFFHEMLRPLAGVRELPLPPGISIERVEESRIPEAWCMAGEAFRDQWSYSESNWTAERLEEKMRSPNFDSALWFVATCEGEIVGSVYNYIKPEENALLGRRRGYVSNVCVSRSWRKKGIAAALLSRGMSELHARGMAEARLGVDSESPTGAMGLYLKVGFTVSNTYVSYGKPMS